MGEQFEVTAGELGLRTRAVELIGGATARRKRLALRGVEPDTLARRLAEAQGG